MRKGEILGLRWHQLDLSKRIIRLEQTKSGKPRLIPINSSLLEILARLKKQTGSKDFIFPNYESGKPLQDIKRSFSTAAKKAGIKGLRIHDLRHTFASRLVEAGVDLITVKELLGHHSVRMTERYTHSNAQQKKSAVELLKPQEKPKFVPNLSTDSESSLLNEMVSTS